MKKLFLFLSIALLVGLNCFISVKSDLYFKANLKLMSEAMARDEEEQRTECCNAMSWEWLSCCLECNSPCCYQMDYLCTSIGGSCAGESWNFAECEHPRF